MTKQPNRAYEQFNFLIDLGTGYDDGPHGGFQEVSSIQKITGLNKSTDVTLKRGVVGAAPLQAWLDQIKKGDRESRRTLSIIEQDEQHGIVQTWKFLRARIVKPEGELLNRGGSDVPIDEMVIAYEGLELK